MSTPAGARDRPELLLTPEPADRQVMASWFVKTGVPPPMREVEVESEAEPEVVQLQPRLPAWVPWAAAAAFLLVAAFGILMLVIVVSVT